MDIMNFGNKLNQIINFSKRQLFRQGEIAQLTYNAFNEAEISINASGKVEFEVSIPVGYRQDRSTIDSPRKYTKEDLLREYSYLAINQLAVNGILQLVTVTEAMLNDVIRQVILKYPKKLGAKNTISMKAVLEANSLDEIHIRATDVLLNEISYKSPREYSEIFQSYIGINLLESPSFHKYVEVKATRDIYIHNQGMANDIYLRKAGSHARVSSGSYLTVDTQYFLESYESCLSLAEFLEQELHQKWHSSDFDNYINSNTNM